MKKKDLPKDRLFEFSCDIYPRKLYIIYDNKDLAQSRFHDNSSGQPLKDDNFQGNYAVTADVRNLKDDYLGILIHFNDNINELGGSKLVGTIAHESLHVLDCLLCNIGATHDRQNDETSAYFIGWVAGKCWEVLQNYIGNDRSNKNKAKR